MGGDVFQWNEADISGSFRGLRGGSWDNSSSPGLLPRNYLNPASEHSYVGFRVASSVAVPEPGTVALLLACAVAFGIWRLLTLPSCGSGNTTRGVTLRSAFAARAPANGQEKAGQLAASAAGELGYSIVGPRLAVPPGDIRFRRSPSITADACPEQPAGRAAGNSRPRSCQPLSTGVKLPLSGPNPLPPAIYAPKSRGALPCQLIPWGTLA